MAIPVHLHMDPTIWKRTGTYGNIWKRTETLDILFISQNYSASQIRMLASSYRVVGPLGRLAVVLAVWE